MLGDVTTQDFGSGLDTPFTQALNLLDELEMLQSKLHAFAEISAAFTAKDGNLSMAAPLRQAIADAPPDMEIPTDVRTAVPRRAATEAAAQEGNDKFSSLASILCLETDIDEPFAIAHIGVDEDTKASLQDTICLSAFCNLARDPNTVTEEVKQFLEEVVDVLLVVEGSEHGPPSLSQQFAALKVVFDSDSADKQAISDALTLLQNPAAKLGKPISLFNVLKIQRARAAQVVAAGQTD